MLFRSRWTKGGDLLWRKLTWDLTNPSWSRRPLLCIGVWAILLYWTAIGPTRTSMPTAKHAVAWTKMDWLTKLICFGFVACGEWNQSQAKLTHSNTSACTSAPATLLRPSHPFRDLTRPGAKTLGSVRCSWSMSQLHLTHLLGNAVAPLLLDLQPTSKGKAKSRMTSNCTRTMGGCCPRKIQYKQRLLDKWYRCKIRLFVYEFIFKTWL